MVRYIIYARVGVVMINQVLVDELVSDIQSGKKDLRECIEDYERQVTEFDNTLEQRIKEIEDSEWEAYEEAIVEACDQLKDEIEE
jgi:hypothetical protein